MIPKTLCFVALFILQITGSCKGSAVARNSSLIQSRVGFSESKWSYTVSYQASLRSRNLEAKKGRGKGLLCGASLISDNVVVTSAYCILKSVESPLQYMDPEDLLVVMGSYYLVDNNENTLDFGVKSFKTGLFKIFPRDHDIALLFLDGKVPANHPIIKPVALNDGPLQDGFMCRAFGWGYKRSSDQDFKEYLLYLDVPLSTSETCRQQTTYKDHIHGGMICADVNNSDYSDADACYYDIGGPYECRGILTGIMSWGTDCGTSINPPVLTNVAKYKGWIIKHVAMHGGIPPSFKKV